MRSNWKGLARAVAMLALAAVLVSACGQGAETPADGGTSPPEVGTAPPPEGSIPADTGAGTDDVMVGDRPIYIDLSECEEAARRFAEERGLTPVNRCDAEALTTEEGDAVHYVVIHYGDAMDCPSGCIYEREAGLVFADRIEVLPDAFPADEQVRFEIQDRLGVSLPAPLGDYTEKRLRRGPDGWQLVLTFTARLTGTAVVNPGWGVTLEAEPADGSLTRQAALAAAWETVQSVCSPAAGERLIHAEAEPAPEGGWQGTVVWGNDKRYHKARFTARPDGTVLLPNGCR